MGENDLELFGEGDMDEIFLKGYAKVFLGLIETGLNRLD
jgi:hypothetical protein